MTDKKNTGGIAYSAGRAEIQFCTKRELAEFIEAAEAVETRFYEPWLIGRSDLFSARIYVKKMGAEYCVFCEGDQQVGLLETLKDEVESKRYALGFLSAMRCASRNVQAGDLIVAGKDTGDPLVKCGCVGVVTEAAGETLAVTFNPSTPWFGPNRDGREDGFYFYLSTGGGPTRGVPLARIRQGVPRKFHYWRWQDYPRKDGGERFAMKTNVWYWNQEGRSCE